MSMTLNLTCEACNKTLWVGQHSNSAGWYIYGTEKERAALNSFVNEHYEHGVRFENSDRVGFDVEDVTVYDEGEPTAA